MFTSCFFIHFFISLSLIVKNSFFRDYISIRVATAYSKNAKFPVNPLLFKYHSALLQFTIILGWLLIGAPTLHFTFTILRYAAWRWKRVIMFHRVPFNNMTYRAIPRKSDHRSPEKGQ